MYRRGCARISESQHHVHRSTIPPVLCPVKPYHPPEWCKRLPNNRNSQPVGQFQPSLTGHLLLVKMFTCRTELRHVWSGAVSQIGAIETMATLSRDGQSHDSDTMWPREFRGCPNVETAFPEATEMGWDHFITRLLYSTPGREHDPWARTIKITWLRRWLQKTYFSTLCNAGGNHGQPIQWSPTNNSGSPGYRCTSDGHE